jgi:hypothetical protein
MKKRFFHCMIVSFCVLIVACSKENEQNLIGPVVVVPTCDTVNMKLSTNVKPILTANCYGCHGNGSSQGGVKLDVYSDLQAWASGGALLGAISHTSGFSPMPKNGAKLSDCDINKIRSWINRGALNN